MNYESLQDTHKRLLQPSLRESENFSSNNQVMTSAFGYSTRLLQPSLRACEAISRIARLIYYRGVSLVISNTAGRTCEDKTYEVEPRPNHETTGSMNYESATYICNLET